MEKIKELDLSILTQLNDLVSNWGFLNKLLAEQLVYLLPIFLLVVWFLGKNLKKVALQSLFSVIVAWPIIATILGKIINRPRPFENGGVQELIFHRPTYSFPSDHAAALFAISTAFYINGQKKLGIYLYIAAVIISFFRVATAIHWPTDIIAGAVLGILSAIAIKALDKYLSVVYDWVIAIAKKLRLA